MSSPPPREETTQQTDAGGVTGYFNTIFGGSVRNKSAATADNLTALAILEQERSGHLPRITDETLDFIEDANLQPSTLNQIDGEYSFPDPSASPFVKPEHAVLFETGIRTGNRVFQNCAPCARDEMRTSARFCQGSDRLCDRSYGEQFPLFNNISRTCDVPPTDAGSFLRAMAIDMVDFFNLTVVRMTSAHPHHVALRALLPACFVLGVAMQFAQFKRRLDALRAARARRAAGKAESGKAGGDKAGEKAECGSTGGGARPGEDWRAQARKSAADAGKNGGTRPWRSRSRRGKR